jgi:hypothetical protein
VTIMVTYHLGQILLLSLLVWGPARMPREADE